MTIIATILVIIGLAGFLLIRREMKSAPLGYEDSTGFHLGREPVTRAELDKAA